VRKNLLTAFTASLSDYRLLHPFLVWEEAIRHWAWVQVEQHGPIWLFLLLFLSGAGLPLPEDVPLIAAGVSIAKGGMSWMVAGPVAWVAMMLGDTMLYVLGYIFGYRVVHLPIIGRHVSEAHLKKCEKWFYRWGLWAVGIGRMFAGIRSAIVVTAGTMRFRYDKLILADSVAAIISGGGFMILGYWAGQHSGQVRPFVEHYRNIFMLVAMSAGLTLAIVLWLKNKRKCAAKLAETRQEVAHASKPI
jgi:membrane protein DedA with SNARE-associated domain